MALISLVTDKVALDGASVGTLFGGVDGNLLDSGLPQDASSVYTNARDVMGITRIILNPSTAEQMQSEAAKYGIGVDAAQRLIDVVAILFP